MMVRFDAGNCDVIVAKQTYSPAQEGGASASIVGRHYRNWDGSSSIDAQPFVRPESVAEFSAVIEALTGLLSDSPRRDIGVTIEDPEMRDSDNYDTKWSSIEILLYSKPGHTLLARLHQRAILPRGADTGGEDRYGPAPSVRERAVLGAVETALQMGAVEQFSEEVGGTPPWNGPSTSWDWHGYIFPLFLGE
jgi:hypothetical protein